MNLFYIACKTYISDAKNNTGPFATVFLPVDLAGLEGETPLFVIQQYLK